MANLASSEFQCAVAAMSYVWGRREAELLEPLPSPHPDAQGFVRRLSHPERDRRAAALAGELARLVNALDARTLK